MHNLKILHKYGFVLIKFDESRSFTAVNCLRDGHSLHAATDPNYLWCSKCGEYFHIPSVRR